MKFFIASPWRNKEAVKDLTDALKLRGHTAYSFLDSGANLATGTSVIEEFKAFGRSMVDWEDAPLIKNIFDSEMRVLGDCDAVLLLEPSGSASLAEAGIAYGLGKQIMLIGLVEHPEVVYRICGSRYATVEAFLDDLDNIAKRSGGE
jgi:hypothetical protein